MNHRIHHIIALSILLLIAGHAGAATDWPDRARPALTATITYEAFDGGEVERLTLTGAGLQLRTGNDMNLRVLDPNPRYSILFENTRFPGSRIGMALFGRSEFLQKIDDGPWDDYLRSLAYAYPKSMEIISNLGPEKTSQRFPIMGSPYRELTFRFQVEADDPVMIRREYYVLMNNRLLVGTIETEERFFEPASSSIRSLLVGLYEVK